MKINILLVLSIVCSTTHAQWTPIDSVANENFLLVHFLNADTGFTYTQPGIMRKTTDGGQSWDSVAMKYQGFLHDMDFPSANVGYAVGGAWFPFGQHYGNAIQKTTDGGQTWDSLTGSYDYGVFTCVEAISETEFYATGRYGVFHSEDGGLTFDTLDISVFPPGAETYVRVDFLNATTGYIMDYSAMFGGVYMYSLYETTDGGQTWQSIYLDSLDTSTRDFVVNANGDILITGMQGEMISSTDGGLSWQVVDPADTSMRFQALSLAGQNLYAMAYSTADSTYGLYRSENWGQSWQREFVSPVASGGITDMSFPSGEVGYFVTHNRIYKNSNLVSQPEFKSLQVAIYPNPANGYLIVELRGESTIVELEIVNVTGQSIGHTNTNGRETLRISTAELAEGVFYLRGLSTGGSIGLGAFVVKR